LDIKIIYHVSSHSRLFCILVVNLNFNIFNIYTTSIIVILIYFVQVYIISTVYIILFIIVYFTRYITLVILAISLKS
jgi:hypothetical protein